MPEKEIPFEENQDVESSASSTVSSTELLIRQNSSSDSSINNVISDIRQNNPSVLEYPLMPHYQPIVIPKEPTLEEMLKQVTGTDDLQSVTAIQLRVISYVMSLHRIPIFIPNLERLNLEGSVVVSLRDLGCDMTVLKHLNVSNCGLKSLDGTNGLTSLEELVADNNLIKYVGTCTNLSNIQKISLKKNCIKNVDEITFLQLCPKLTSLDFTDNPVTRSLGYREIVKENIPQLNLLDDCPFSINELTVFESTSSLSTGSDNDEAEWNNKNDEEVEQIMSIEDAPMIRPATAIVENICSIEIVNPIRPATGVSESIRSQLTTGEPIYGNIITKARKARRQRTAWGDSTSCSSMSSSDSSNNIREFPDRLPQQHVDLELGVIGIQNDTDEDKSLNENQFLLEAARGWRQRSQQNREEIRNADNLRIANLYTQF